MSRVVLVTGARGGLGRAVVAACMDRGWTPVAVGRDPASLAAALDPAVAQVAGDVSTQAGAAAVMSACVAAHGVPDAVVNCAGQVLVAALHRTSEAQYRACLAANVDSAFFVLRAYVEALKSAPKPAAVVLVSSVAARIGIANHEAVAAAKGAVEALTRSAAATYSAQGLRVNCVAPGLIETPATAAFVATDAGRKGMAAQYPLGRYGQPDDVAGLIAWLAAPEATWVTGQVIGVDGGFAAVRPPVRVPV